MQTRGLEGKGSYFFLFAGGQLALGLVACPVMLASPGTCLGLCLAMEAMMAGCIHQFRKVDKISGWLMSPVLLWSMVETSMLAYCMTRMDKDKGKKKR